MTESPPRSRQEAAIVKNWPRCAKQLHSTYFTDEDWACTKSGGTNSAGYMSWALQRMENLAQTQHAHKNFTREELDLAASREVYYQWQNGRSFQHTEAALARCLLNLVIERPEKLLEARKLQQGWRPGKKERISEPRLIADSVPASASELRAEYQAGQHGLQEPATARRSSGPSTGTQSSSPGAQRTKPTLSPTGSGWPASTRQSSSHGPNPVQQRVRAVG